MQDREWFAPVALPAEEPVAQFVRHRALAFALGFQPLNHGGLGFTHAEAIQEFRVDGGAISGECLAVEVFWRLNGADDRQVEHFSERPIPLILSGYGHDGSRTVAHQNVVSDPDRDTRTTGWVDGIGSRENSRFHFGVGHAIDVGLARRILAIGIDCIAVVGCGQLINQLMFRGQYQVRGTEQRVWSGREDLD